MLQRNIGMIADRRWTYGGLPKPALEPAGFPPPTSKNHHLAKHVAGAVFGLPTLDLARNNLAIPATR
jgi:hypothetical protein